MRSAKAGIVLFTIAVVGLVSSGNNLILALSETPQKLLGYSATVNLRLVQVFVLDKNGNSVPDLKKEDLDQIVWFAYNDNKESFELHVL